ncbi:hypothetical protein ACS0TY_012769 [Phlomoides rotata]
MSRSFSNAKAVSAFIAGKISRRSYAVAAASQGSVSRIGAPNVLLKKGSEDSTKISWVPDPITGFYRPENQVKENATAELRGQVIRNKARRD